jgi:hypothetical protein
MTQLPDHPKRSQIPARELNAKERSWIQEILNANKLWRMSISAPQGLSLSAIAANVERPT